MIDVNTLAPLVVAARVLLGLVFLTAAVGKFRDPEAFYGAVHGYRLLPDDLVGPVARLVPWFEVAVGLALPTGLVPFYAALFGAAMLAAFAYAMAINMKRGRRDIDCGCFRARTPHRLTWNAVMRTLGLAATALFSGFPAIASVVASAQGFVAGATLFLLFITASSLPTFGRSRPRISL